MHPGRQRRSHLVQRVGQHDVRRHFHRREARHQLAGIGYPIIHHDPDRPPSRAEGFLVQLPAISGVTI
jgi:hypothetical protein